MLRLYIDVTTFTIGIFDKIIIKICYILHNKGGFFLVLCKKVHYYTSKLRCGGNCIEVGERQNVRKNIVRNEHTARSQGDAVSSLDHISVFNIRQKLFAVHFLEIISESASEFSKGQSLGKSESEHYVFAHHSSSADLLAAVGNDRFAAHIFYTLKILIYGGVKGESCSVEV